MTACAMGRARDLPPPHSFIVADGSIPGCAGQQSSSAFGRRRGTQRSCWAAVFRRRPGCLRRDAGSRPLSHETMLSCSKGRDVLMRISKVRRPPTSAVATPRGGTVIAIRGDWTQRAVDVRIVTIMRAGCDASWHGSTAPNSELPRRTAIQHLRWEGAWRCWMGSRRCVDSAPLALVVVGGDWNFVPSDETRMTAEGEAARSADRTGERSERLFQALVEVYQHGLVVGFRGCRRRAAELTTSVQRPIISRWNP